MSTVRDASRQRLEGAASRQHNADVRYLKGKVRYWQRKVEKFGGEIHRLTLEKFRDRLLELK